MKEIKEYFKRALAMDKELDPKGWKTNKHGQHYHIDGATGEIDAGMGGKFNGKKVSGVKESGASKSNRDKSNASKSSSNYIKNKDVIDYWMNEKSWKGSGSHTKSFVNYQLKQALINEYKQYPADNANLSNRLDGDLVKELEDIYKNGGDKGKGSAIAHELDKRAKAQEKFMDKRMSEGKPPMPQKTEFQVKYRDKNVITPEKERRQNGNGKNQSIKGRVYRYVETGEPIPKISAERLAKLSDEDLKEKIQNAEHWLNTKGKERNRKDAKEIRSHYPNVKSWLQDWKGEAKKRGLK